MLRLSTRKTPLCSCFIQLQCAHSSLIKTTAVSSRCLFIWASGEVFLDASDTSRCITPLCGGRRASVTVDVCSECALGHFPCSNLCSRGCDTSSPTSQRLCHLCALCFARSSAVTGTTTSQASSFAELSAQYTSCSAHYPNYACSNFPFCRKSQKKLLAPSSDGYTFQGRHSFCTSCINVSQSGRICFHSDCKHPPALCAGGKDSNGLCSTHVRDPAHASLRAWPLCRNSEDRVLPHVEYREPVMLLFRCCFSEQEPRS